MATNKQNGSNPHFERDAAQFDLFQQLMVAGQACRNLRICIRNQERLKQTLKKTNNELARIVTQADAGSDSLRTLRANIRATGVFTLDQNNNLTVCKSSEIGPSNVD